MLHLTLNMMLAVFRQAYINIPLLEVAKQVLAYAKFLKDPVTIKRKHNVQIKAFLIKHPFENVSTLIPADMPIKYANPGCSNSLGFIGQHNIVKVLMNEECFDKYFTLHGLLTSGLDDLKPTFRTI